jgi:hypothetical protein
MNFLRFLGEFPETGTAIALLIADRLVLLGRRIAHARTVNVFTEKYSAIRQHRVDENVCRRCR